MAKNTISVYLVDDHAVVRQGTRDMLTQHPRIQVVGEADCGDGLLADLSKTEPQLLLLDINLPGKNGLDILADVKRERPKVAVVMFTAHTDVQYIWRAKQLGADGYLSKTVDSETLLAAIIQVVDEGTAPVYSKDVAQKLSAHESGSAKNTPTAREMEILLLVSQGMTNQDIAERLVVSVKTVDTHVANLMKKVGVNKRTQLTAYAFKQGLVE